MEKNPFVILILLVAALVSSASLQAASALALQPTITLQGTYLPVYSTRYMLVNLTVAENATLKYAEITSSYPYNRTICSLCDRFSQTMGFTDGQHTLAFYSQDKAGLRDEKLLSFIIDNTNPVISTTYPVGGYATGMFNISYTETSCVSIKLTVTSPTHSAQATVPCVSGTNVKEHVAMDLHSFENETISYTFTVTDIVGRTASRTVVKQLVDTIPPHFNYFETKLVGRNLLWNISMDSQARYLRFIDYGVSGKFERYLCDKCIQFGYTGLKASCDYGTSAIRENYFPPGNHNVTVIATDAAGNTARKENIVFTTI